MFKNYLKVAFRALGKNKSFSGLNILGLSLGIACSLLIFLWVHDEREISPNKIDADYENPAPLGDELKKTIPEVGAAVTIDGDDDFTFRSDGQRGGERGGGRGGKADDKTIKAKGGYAGGDFFNMFSFTLLGGNAATALLGPADIAPPKAHWSASSWARLSCWPYWQWPSR